MPLSKEQTTSAEVTIKESLRKKFQNYNPESKNMPFQYRLLGKDRMALYSFIHSLNTNFGTSIYEPVAEALGRVDICVIIVICQHSPYLIGNGQK